MIGCISNCRFCHAEERSISSIANIDASFLSMTMASFLSMIMVKKRAENKSDNFKCTL